MVKTIAQMAILNWVECHFGIGNIDLCFTDAREAFVTDENGDTITLKYDSNTHEVFVI